MQNHCVAYMAQWRSVHWRSKVCVAQWFCQCAFLLIGYSRNELRLRVLFVLAAFDLTARGRSGAMTGSNFSRFGSGILSQSGLGPDLVSI